MNGRCHPKRRGFASQQANGASAAATIAAGPRRAITRALFMRFNSSNSPVIRCSGGRNENDEAECNCGQAWHVTSAPSLNVTPRTLWRRPTTGRSLDRKKMTQDYFTNRRSTCADFECHRLTLSLGKRFQRSEDQCLSSRNKATGQNPGSTNKYIYSMVERYDRLTMLYALALAVVACMH